MDIMRSPLEQQVSPTPWLVSSQNVDAPSLIMKETFDRSFIGAHAMNQVILMNSHPTGEMTATQRIEAMIAQGGIRNCGKAAICQAV